MAENRVYTPEEKLKIVLESVGRTLVNMRIIPYYEDYTTVWHKIHDKGPSLDIHTAKYVHRNRYTELKTINAGSYRITKYGDHDAIRRDI